MPQPSSDNGSPESAQEVIARHIRQALDAALRHIDQGGNVSDKGLQGLANEVGECCIDCLKSAGHSFVVQEYVSTRELDQYGRPLFVRKQ